MLTKKQYEKLVARQEEASHKNDYSKMIMMSDPEAIQMKEYFQNKICEHPDVGTDGGGDYCKSCGKRWDR